MCSFVGGRRLTLGDVERGPGLALGILIRGKGSIAFDQDGGSVCAHVLSARLCASKYMDMRVSVCTCANTQMYSVALNRHPQLMKRSLDTKLMTPKTGNRTGERRGRVYEPFLQREEVIPARALLHEAGDPEPAGATVFTTTHVAGDAVSQNLAAGAGSVYFGRVAEVADDGHTGPGTDRSGAEGSRGRSGGDEAGGGAEEGRHFERLSN
jgi:hypothetical protein